MRELGRGQTEGIYGQEIQRETKEEEYDSEKERGRKRRPLILTHPTPPAPKAIEKEA